MRKLLIIAALVLTACDHVTGTGTLGQFSNPTARVDAIQTKAGVRGSFTITYPDHTFATANDTCLYVSGNTAYVTGRITRSGGPRYVTPLNWLPGNYIVIGIQDNGNPGTVPDQLNFSPGFATDPGCGPNSAATPDFPIVSGNYRVTDTP